MYTKKNPSRSYLLKLGLCFLAGALGGFLYYYFIGCQNGTCPISSRPGVTTVYGGAIGLVLGLGFVRRIPKGQ